MMRALIITLSCFLTGCLDLGLSQEQPERLRYVLDVQRPSSANASGQVVLEIRSFHGTAAYIDNDFVYRRGSVVTTDYYNGFLTPPTVAISELCRHWLGDSGNFGIVQGVGTRMPPTHALEADIYALYGDFADPATPKAVLEIAFALVQTTDAALIARRTYKEAITIASDSPVDLVNGWNQGLAALFAKLEVDLQGALAR